MADSEHIEVLRRGPRVWNAWRGQHPSILPNLVGIALSIGERQMGPINGGPINLTFARLSRAFLRFATLTAADFEGADLSDADLSDARLEDANLAGADLSDAILDRADLSGANLAGANLCGASLKEVRNLTQEQLEEADGDGYTLLPDHLRRPQGWTAARVVKGSRERREIRASEVKSPPRPEPSRSGPAKPKRHVASAGERISWLVGGPRRASRAERADTPVGDG